MTFVLFYLELSKSIFYLKISKWHNVLIALSTMTIGPRVVVAVQNSNDNNKEQNEGKRCH